MARARILVLSVVSAIVLAACGSSGGEQATPKRAAPAEKPGRCDWGMNTVAYWAQDPPTSDDGSHEDMGNSHGAQVWKPIVDTKVCDELQSQMDDMDAVTEKYPTAQDALDAGCYRATVFVPGIAAHYVCVQNASKTAALDKPLMLLYGGSAPTAPMIGLSYMIYSEGPPSDEPDAPVWVEYMPWHFHSGLCVNEEGLVIGGDNSDPTTCEARGGKVQGRTGWMGHYWLDNCPSPDGVFSAENPRLDWNVGTFNDLPENAANPASIIAEPCQGSKMPVDPEGKDRFGKPAGMSARHKVDDHGSMDHDMGDMDHDSGGQTTGGGHGHDATAQN